LGIRKARLFPHFRICTRIGFLRIYKDDTSPWGAESRDSLTLPRGRVCRSTPQLNARAQRPGRATRAPVRCSAWFAVPTAARVLVWFMLVQPAEPGRTARPRHGRCDRRHSRLAGRSVRRIAFARRLDTRGLRLIARRRRGRAR
jgi:hypothetical protein